MQMKNADTSRQDEFNLSEHKVALCKKKRYQNCTHPAYETYKDLTCFDIHHNVHQYPPCICSSTQEESQARIATSKGKIPIYIALEKFRKQGTQILHCKVHNCCSSSTSS